MDLLFIHNQEKKDKKSKSLSTCDLKLFNDDVSIIYKSTFDFDYQRYGRNKKVLFEHELILNKKTGDIHITYKIINDGLTDMKMFKSTIKQKKNNFSLLLDLTENGFERGEKRIGFWGVKYSRATSKILDLIYSLIKDKFKSEFIVSKITKGEFEVNFLYDMIVDFHLEMKGIKGHNSVYYDIQHDYPKKKWLEKNDYKFLPSVLDHYGIKSKYLIGELNKYHSNKSIKLNSLNYICKLFGDNYLDYLKKINWEKHCFDYAPNNKLHQLKNDSEKNCMVNIINKWENDSLKTDSLVYLVNKLLSIRELLEVRGVDLKFKAKNDSEFDNLLEMWSGIKFHFARGYKVRYDLPKEFLDEIEEDILIDGELFKPKVLVTEEDFRIEGFNMKNCMSKQFLHGSIYIYVGLQCKRKRINLQYRKGGLVQSYGKANTPTLEMFNDAITILTQRFKKYTYLEWKKEKYDFLTNSFSIS
jgi:hypothetical protein